MRKPHEKLGHRRDTLGRWRILGGGTAGGVDAGSIGRLDLWVWGTRQALLRAGLQRVVIETPVGPQTAFVGGAGPVLVLLHGAADQAGTWARVVSWLLPATP